MQAQRTTPKFALWIALGAAVALFQPGAAAAEDETLLNYAVVQGEYVDVGSTVSLDIVVSLKPQSSGSSSHRPGRHRPAGKPAVLVEEIEIVIGVEGSASDLTGTPEGIKTKVTRPDSNRPDLFVEAPWDLTHPVKETGRFVAKPQAGPGGTAGKNAIVDRHSVIVLTLSRIPVNKVGTADIKITETASAIQVDDQGEMVGSAGSSQVATTSTRLAKFRKYYLSDLVGAPKYIPYEGEATVTWNGSPDASYTLEWDRPEGVQGPIPVGHKGPYTIRNNVDDPNSPATPIRSSVNFTLRSVRTENDQDVKEKRTERVVVIPPDPKLNKLAAEWKANGELLLEWDTEFYKDVHFLDIPGLTGTQSPKGRKQWSPESLPSRLTLRGTDRNGDVVAIGTLNAVWKNRGKTREVGIGSIDVAQPEDRSVVYLAHEFTNNITILDGATFKELDSSPIQVAQEWKKSNRAIQAIELSHDGQHLFVALRNDTDVKNGELLKLDVKSGRVVSRKPIGTTQGLVASSSGARVYAITYGTDNKSRLTALDTRSMNPVPGSPKAVEGSWQYLAISPDGTKLYATDTSGGGVVHVVNARDLSSDGAPVKVGPSPSSLALSPDHERLFVVNFEFNKPSSVTVLERGTWKQVEGSPKKIGKGTRIAGFSPGGSLVFFTNFQDHDVAILDAKTLERLPKSPVGLWDMNPIGVAFSPTGARALAINPRGTCLILEQEFELARTP